MSRHSSLRRMRVLLRHGGLLLIGIAVLVGVLGAIVLPSPARATVVADIATAIPIPPTEEPRPTEPPPTEQPRPTDPPPTEQPRPTEPPPTQEPRPTDKPRPHERDRPTATPVPPTATPVPPTATPVLETNIRVRKAVNVESAHSGDTIAYTIVVENTGSSPAYDVVLTDPVPPSVEVIDLKSSKGDIVVSGQTVTAYPSTLAPGEQASYTVTGRVGAGAAPGSTIANTATVITSTPGDDPNDNSSTARFRIPVPPAVTPVPTARTTIFHVPRTADPDETGLVWALLPWTLLGVLVIGVGGLLAWSIASTRGLTQQLLAFMAPRALTPATAGSNVDAADGIGATDTRTAEEPLHALSNVLLTSPPAPRSSGLPPLGTPFAQSVPAGPLPPLVALDREAALRPEEER